ncbi:thioredoxin domain-containing protein [Niveispirillum sp. BGYR6]|uniref:DsbA family protein n=1 Tax=Niveispirillum sp. BGYR6 TaxID=2971249 RepID=UPI0022B94466|nr:thioredoxin domain-containing protein [Niveispirillum sp. BGYR6]MDG5495996.1 thioredoxin domain-containing protein [Niveispirillum sp. BGYR6]
MLKSRLAQYFSFPVALCALGISVYGFFNQQKIVYEYVMRHPEIIAESLIRLSEQQDQEALNKSSLAIKDGEKQLQQQPYDLVLNPNGKYTVVEFFDYNCPYCHKTNVEIKEFAQKNPHVKFILKNLPILGPDSVLAATVVAKAISQGQDKAIILHDQFMAQKNDASNIKVLAKNNNIDLSEADLKIESSFEDNKKLAKNIGTGATPSFIYNNKMYMGGDLKWLDEIPKT